MREVVVRIERMFLREVPTVGSAVVRGVIWWIGSERGDKWWTKVQRTKCNDGVGVELVSSTVLLT